MWAARSNHIAVMKRLLDSGAEINAASNEGFTALSTAALAGHADAVGYLMDEGADPGIPLTGGTWEGRTAKDIARQMGQTAVSMQLQPRMLRLAARGDCDGLEQAALDGLDLDARSDEGCTPLIFASRCQRVDACRMLVSLGCNIDAVDDNGDSAMVWAARSEDHEIFSYLSDAGAAMPQDMRKLYRFSAAFLP